MPNNYAWKILVNNLCLKYEYKIVTFKIKHFIVTDKLLWPIYHIMTILIYFKRPLYNISAVFYTSFSSLLQAFQIYQKKTPQHINCVHSFMNKGLYLLLVDWLFSLLKCRGPCKLESTRPNTKIGTYIK